MKREALRVSTTIPAAPTTLYLAWLASERHSDMTGAPAKIDGTVGGNFTAANGYISGKLVTLDLGRRLVMSWRTTDFPREAPDSRVEIHFEALGGSTRLTVLHTEIPEGQGETYRARWNDAYFVPMRTFFSKYLPDPRKPPPPRRPIPPEDDEPDEDEALPPKKGKLGGKAPPSPAPSKKAPPSPAPSKKPPPAPPKGPPPKAAKPTPSTATSVKPARVAGTTAKPPAAKPAAVANKKAAPSAKKPAAAKPKTSAPVPEKPAPARKPAAKAKPKKR